MEHTNILWRRDRFIGVRQNWGPPMHIKKYCLDPYSRYLPLPSVVSASCRRREGLSQLGEESRLPGIPSSRRIWPPALLLSLFTRPISWFFHYIQWSTLPPGAFTPLYCKISVSSCPFGKHSAPYLGLEFRSSFESLPSLCSSCLGQSGSPSCLCVSLWENILHDELFIFLCFLHDVKL